MRRLILSLLLTTLPAPVFAAPPPAVARAIADPARPKDDVAADPVRLPAETIAFAGVKPGMTVGEFYPGSGYFTRLLSDVVGPKGHVFAMENDKWKEQPIVDALQAYGAHNVTIEVAPLGTVRFARPIDIAWVTQNYHDLKIAKYGVVDIAAFNRAVFAAVKPGGVFMVIDHEAPAGTSVEDIAKLHRIEKAQVIREVEAAGFKLADEGKFLRHPDDNHMLSIFDKSIRGKTDQYALKFVKPK